MRHYWKFQGEREEFKAKRRYEAKLEFFRVAGTGVEHPVPQKLSLGGFLVNIGWELDNVMGSTTAWH